MPSSIVVRLSDREAQALVAPFWRRMFFTSAEWVARARASSIVQRALEQPEVSVSVSVNEPRRGDGSPLNADDVAAAMRRYLRRNGAEPS